MTIKELMRDVNVNRVADAFLLLDYNFSESNYESSFFEKFQAIPSIRHVIEHNVRLLAECKPMKMLNHIRYLFGIILMKRILNRLENGYLRVLRSVMPKSRLQKKVAPLNLPATVTTLF